MRKKIVITYWWKCDKVPKGIPKEMAETLEESAEDRIRGMMNEGYTSGQLRDFVRVKIPGHKTPKDGHDCYGWFEVVKKDAEPEDEKIQNLDEHIIKEHLEYFKQGLIRHGAPSTITNRDVFASCGFNDSLMAFRMAFKKGMWVGATQTLNNPK